MINKLTQALATTRVFSDTKTDALRMLTSAATPLRVRGEQHLFQAGDSADAFFWLESGVVRLYRLTHDGEEKVFQMFGDGDLVAETAMFTQPCHYPLSAQAETDCMLYRLPRSTL